MKKIITLVAALFMLVTISACSSKTEEVKPSSLLEEVKQRGYISVATEGEWSPWTYHDETTDELTGFDVELAKYIADGLGVEVKYEETVWDSILAGVSSQRFDLGVNGVDWTAERAESYNFSDPYVFTSSVLIVPADNTDITCFEDLDGKVTTNSIGSVYQTIAEGYGATVIVGDTFADTINLINRGDADATINAAESYGDYIKAQPDAPIKIVAQTEGNPICVISCKGEYSESLIAEVNTILAGLRADGTLAELSVKYFGLDITNK